MDKNLKKQATSTKSKKFDGNGNFYKEVHRLQKLKEIDTFGVPIKVYFHRDHSNSDDFETHEKLGSYFGGITTLICYCALSIYLYLLASKMSAGENDNTNTAVLTNPLDDASNSMLNINNMSFLPYLEMDQQSFNHTIEEFEIMESAGNQTFLSYDKLSRYIEIVVNIKRIDD